MAPQNPHPPLKPLIRPAHCEWKILCLHKKLDFCISYGNEKTSTWFVFHWFTRFVSLHSLLFNSLHFSHHHFLPIFFIFFFFFLASVYAGQKKTVFGNSRKTVWISFIHFGFSLRILPCCCWRPLVFGFVHLLFGLLRSMEMQSQREKKKNLKIYSCLMLIRFGSWINPIAKRPLGVKMEKQGACCKLTLRVSGCFRLCVCVCLSCSCTCSCILSIRQVVGKMKHSPAAAASTLPHPISHNMPK